mmetsp:Transcript_10698/g.17448  ORF Transcript_10698/g.17448 Transcript_10698/m.17448 type:complete len:289 (-) Transcript_10698:92-958(-)
MFAHLLPPSFSEEVLRWAKEDCPATDIGGFVVGEKEESATLYCKSSTVVAGVPFVNALLDHYGLTYDWKVEEGQYIDTDKAGGKVIAATISGKCRCILLVERTCLNILSRASGVAAAARKARMIKDENNWHGVIAGTRKITPGFKNVEKYALIVGGVATHRLDLSQMVMLKDNHIWSAGSITNAVKAARIAAGFTTKIEVECQNVNEALEAAAAGADIVMLDNFTPDSIEDAAKQVKVAYPHLIVEASGGITEATMHLYMSPSVDVISRGSLTQGYACADYSMKIDHA